ncbi:MAG: hypothetical protein ACLUT3_01465 [Bifidobacterium bifidum]
MGGLGSGIAHDEEELHRIAGAGLHYSPTDEVLLEESVLRLEGIRARSWCATAATTSWSSCPIENVDPVGVHTGDSITVAPAASR